MRILTAVGLALFFFAAGCNKPASKEECQKAVDHMMDILVKSSKDPSFAKLAEESAKENKEQAVTACVEHGTRKEVRCLLAAKKEAELDACSGS